MVIHEKQDLRSIKDVAEEFIDELAEFNKKGSALPSDETVAHHHQVYKHFMAMHRIFINELEGKIPRDLATLIRRKEELLADLKDMGFDISETGLFEKEYELEEYLEEQINILEREMKHLNKESTFKECKERFGKISKSLRIILRTTHQLLTQEENYKEDVTLVSHDIKEEKKSL